MHVCMCIHIYIYIYIYIYRLGNHVGYPPPPLRTSIAACCTLIDRLWFIMLSDSSIVVN